MRTMILRTPSWVSDLASSPTEANFAEYYRISALFQSALSGPEPDQVRVEPERGSISIKPAEKDFEAMYHLVDAWLTKFFPVFSGGKGASATSDTYSLDWHYNGEIWFGLFPKANRPDDDGFFEFTLHQHLPVPRLTNCNTTKKETAMIPVTHHVVEGAGSQLTIHAADAKGSGGAHHRYEITNLNMSDNPAAEGAGLTTTLVIPYQQGPVPQHGINGVTIEAVVATAIHRLECFQAGPFACAANQEALDYFKAGVDALQRRTRDRVAREVEGKEVA